MTLHVDYLRIYVLYADGSLEQARLAQRVADHFDGLGMERDGVAIRVPVRFRSEPWSAGVRPRPIDLSLARHNAVVLLHDEEMAANAEEWNAYVTEVRTNISGRGGRDVYIPFGSPTREPPLQFDNASHTQYANRAKWTDVIASAQAREARLLLHLVTALRRHLREFSAHAGSPEHLFVSHAKADGDEVARDIVRYVNDVDQDVPLRLFYDAKELAPGENYQARFEQDISNGTLLAIVSDIYESRPWCVFELTTAKRARRPIVLADVGEVRTSRTYPYGANLPKVRVGRGRSPQEWVEPLLVETMSEGLRCDVFEGQAAALLAARGLDALVLPRPPELFDLCQFDLSTGLVLYPDPPLAELEREILQRAAEALAPSLRIRTFSEA